MNISVDMRGEQEIISAMKELGGKDAGKALRSALSFVSGRMAKRFGDKAKKRTGALSRSFSHAEWIFGNEGAIKSWVGVSTKHVERNVLEKTEWRGRTYWRNTKFKKPIMYVRKIEAATGWMLATWEAEAPKILQSIKGDIWKKIAAAVRRRAKKAQ